MLQLIRDFFFPSALDLSAGRRRTRPATAAQTPAAPVAEAAPVAAAEPQR